MVPRTNEFGFTVLTLARRRVKELIHKLRRGFDDSDRKRRLFHTLECCGEGAHVCNLSRHQELQCLLRPLILRKTDEPFVDNLRSRLGGDVTAQIYCHIPGYLPVVCSPGVSHGIEKRDTTAACDRYQRVCLRRFAAALHGLQMHPNQGSYHFKVAQFFCSDVHEKVLAG